MRGKGVEGRAHYLLVASGWLVHVSRCDLELLRSESSLFSCSDLMSGMGERVM